jgi:hypothetical protein
VNPPPARRRRAGDAARRSVAHAPPGEMRARAPARSRPSRSRKGARGWGAPAPPFLRTRRCACAYARKRGSCRLLDCQIEVARRRIVTASHEEEARQTPRWRQQASTVTMPPPPLAHTGLTAL